MAGNEARRPPRGDRIAGAVVALFGLALLFLVIPDQVEAVDYGWVRPESLPNACAIAMVLLGLWQALAVRERFDLRPAAALRSLGYLLLATLAAWAMGRFGFLWIAPVMMAAVMLLIGERRPLWLLAGTVAAPGLIWLVVVVLLNRSLPG